MEEKWAVEIAEKRHQINMIEAILPVLPKDRQKKFKEKQLEELKETLDSIIKNNNLHSIRRQHKEKIGVTALYADSKDEFIDIAIKEDAVIPYMAEKHYFVMNNNQKEMGFSIGIILNESNMEFFVVDTLRIVLPNHIKKNDEVIVKIYLIEENKLIVRATMGDNTDLVYKAIDFDIPNNKNFDEIKRNSSGLPASIEKEFTNITGMQQVKDQLAKFYSQIRMNSIREDSGFEVEKNKPVNFVLLGNPGTGKTMVARMLGKILHELNIRENANLIEVDRGKLVDEYIGGTAPKTQKILEQVKKVGGTLFIDEAYQLFVKDSEKDFGSEAITTLLKDMEDNRGKYSVIIAGYKKQIMNMLENANPGFKSRFQYYIEIPDYSDEELLEIATNIAAQKGLCLNEDAKEAFLTSVSKEKVDESFANARTAREIINKAQEELDNRVSIAQNIELEDMYILRPEDFGVDLYSIGDNFLEDKLNELDSMIGLASAKAKVHEIVDAMVVNQALKEKGIDAGSGIGTMHLVFKGNAGTGKTTVARIIADIYKALGFLKKGRVVECGASDLIGRYVGETPQKTKAKIKEALGGALFIDEAYALSKSPGGFGQEAIDTLIADMENYRDNLMIIVAGYPQDMDTFLQANQGLQSRLSNEIYFDDYSIDELLQILKKNISGKGKILEEGSDDSLTTLICESKEKVRDFGNARGVRNLVDKLCLKSQSRIAKLLSSNREYSTDDLRTITKEDIELCREG